MKILRSCLIGVSLLFGVFLISCNRPIPSLFPPMDATSDLISKPLSLTQTSIAGDISATLSAAKAATEGQVSPSDVTAITAQAVGASTTQEPPTSEQPAAGTPSAGGPAPSETGALVLPIIQTTGEGSASVAPVTATPKSPAEFSTSQKISPAMPDVYFLKKGEFPWCLARRFNVNPRQLMKVNGFFYGQTFFTGQKVVFPKNPRPFPGNRALRSRPDTYRVLAYETIYSIACYYGDLDPIMLAKLNGLEPPYRVSPGQVLLLP